LIPSESAALSRSALNGSSSPFAPRSLGSGAWQTKFDIVSQGIPSKPSELRPMQSPVSALLLGGNNAEARSPSQFESAPSVSFDIEVRTEQVDTPRKFKFNSKNLDQVLT